MAGYQVKEIYLGTKEHTSFDDYREDVGKLAKMAEQVEFTILKEAFKFGRLRLPLFTNFNSQYLFEYWDKIPVWTCWLFKRF